MRCTRSATAAAHYSNWSRADVLLDHRLLRWQARAYALFDFPGSFQSSSPAADCGRNRPPGMTVSAGHYALAADALLVAHAGYVLFVVGGQILILLGAWRYRKNKPRFSE